MEESVLLSLKGPGLKRNPGARSGRRGRERRSRRRGTRTGQACGKSEGLFSEMADGNPDRADESREQTEHAERKSRAFGRKACGTLQIQGSPEERGCAGRDASNPPNAGMTNSCVSRKRCGAGVAGRCAACALPRRGQGRAGARFRRARLSAEGFFQPFSRLPGPEVTMPRSMRRRRYQFLSLTSMWS